jgi:hypothetical protein
MRACPVVMYNDILSTVADTWHLKGSQIVQAMSMGVKEGVQCKFPGVARLNSIRVDFNNARAVWQPYQSQVFEMFLNANIINILGSDSDSCLEKVMRDSHWEDVPDEMLVVAVRGSGKSTMLACAVAAFMKGILNYTAMVYSGIQAKGNDLLVMIYDALMVMLDHDPSVKVDYVRKTATTITLSIEGNVRQIRAASSLGMV